jgi:dihydropyrimidine dehydrogenase (NAD+) subunit PreT
MSLFANKDTQLPEERLENAFTDFKPALNAAEAETEANRCIGCYDAPCISACPTGINIPQFISRIANNNLKGSAKTILDSNIFGLSCAQSCPTEVLCEGACVYKSLNKKPISIGKLQRFAVEYAYENEIEFYKPGKPTGKQVALIGAGAASLACAHELRKLGHETVVFEKAELPGGLNTTGIAPYKMKSTTSLQEIKRIQKMGVEIKYKQELGKNVQIDALLKDFDAIFFGMGLGPDSKLDTVDSTNPHVFGAVDFVSKIKTQPSSALENFKHVQTAVVVGGGNTALDACRELKKLGVERVVVSYRRGQEDMSGYRHEFAHARQEGVEFLFNTVVTSMENASTGVAITLNEKTTFQAELVLLAIGQSKLEKMISKIPGLAFEHGKLLVDEHTGQTGNLKVFAGGDLVNGGKEVVNAVAEGKKAARGIEKFLRGEAHG